MSEQIINGPQGVTQTTTVTSAYTPGDGTLVVGSTASPLFPSVAPFHFVVWSATTGLPLVRFECTAITNSTHLAVTVESGDTDVALPVGAVVGFCLTKAGIDQYIAAVAPGGTVTHTGSLTGGQLLKGNGSADITAGNLTGQVTTSGGMATTVTVHDEPMTDGASNFIFASGDVVVATGVPN